MKSGNKDYYYFLKENTAKKFLFIGCCSVAAGVYFLHFPALMSVGAILIFLSGIVRKNFTKRIFSNPQSVSIIFFFLLPLISFFYITDVGLWNNITFRKISFVMIAVGLAGNYLKQKEKNDIYIIFAMISFLVTLFTFINYVFNYTEINESIIHSKGVPVISGISHIYFSVMASFSVFVFYYLYSEDSTKKFHKNIFLVCGIFIFTALHFLASRTGLVSLYLASFSLLIRHVITVKKYISGILFLIFIILLPVAAYNFSDAFHNKIESSLIDMKAYFNNQYIGYQSISMRFEAWRACLNIFSKHPFTGVGTDLTHHMDLYYNSHKIVPEARVGEAHNQFLQNIACYGFTGFIILLFSLYKIISKQEYKNILPLTFFMVCIGAFLFESFLESHVGIAFYSLFAMVLANKND